MKSKPIRRQETFRTAMRNNAAEFDEHNQVDAHMEGLDFHEFCELVYERETGEHTIPELRQRFRDLDVAGTGRIHKHDYLRFSLRDALARSVNRISEIFEQWDSDGSGQIDFREFRRAVLSLGFADVADKQIEQIFRELDEVQAPQCERFDARQRCGC